ncbi:Rpn family recombination-promoting nuclease/putative transposase [Pseudoduganella sp. LjRoot289]|uniref:Rpn family recombination-promoting nuclease/putative transposase n=1 Tax=Pseudoduganella sp. LjRoot289 TaxID=3342314 RepID=UPI003ECE55C0
MKADHDTGYKQLFAHPELMRDLLQAFVPYPWAKDLDVSAFERLNASYAGDNGEQRHDDMVWRVRVGGECLYIYLLLEFQSRSDHWMALRMQVYVGLLCQDLIKQGKLGRNGKLSPVLPIVLYSGKRAWTASQSLSALMLSAPDGLGWLQPEQNYLLIDQRTVGDTRNDAERNMVAALFRLEHSRSKSVCVDLILALSEWLRTDSTQSLRDSLSRWISRCMQRRLIRNEFPPEEELIMIEKEFDSWEECLIDELLYGRKEGKEEGKAEGLEQGKLDAHREFLHRLVAKHDGMARPAVAAMIDAAPLQQLEHWLDSLLDGATPQDLFNSK